MNIGKRVRITESPFESEDSLDLIGKTATVIGRTKYHGHTVYLLDVDELTEEQENDLIFAHILFHEDWLEELEEEPNEES